jgi:hypothetical protein
MKMMGTTAVLVATMLAGGCASMGNTETTSTGDRPVGTSGTVSTGPEQVNGSERGVIPAGQELDVRLQTPLSSDTAKPEQRFETRTAVDLKQGDAVLVPAGSIVRGVVASVSPAGKIDRSGSMTLAFDQLVGRSREYPIRAMATQAFESGGIREEAATVGTAGAVGAIVGGVIGGLKGALIGAVIGSGGVIAATNGKDVELKPGTIIRIRLDEPVRLRSAAQ